ncbi:hypothetical protein PoB_004492100 [Plakobranchus ocellatus]|uniref:Uncharacterized protein n=1 Tax=Plakobranchus ocellatus TaxID=259542 RepID=A0AAV4B4X5_9GAST|nr:hypothetical protein PoB_004492100 [Plakobranchus ocellatus]
MMARSTRRKYNRKLKVTSFRECSSPVPVWVSGRQTHITCALYGGTAPAMFGRETESRKRGGNTSDLIRLCGVLGGVIWKKASEIARPHEGDSV